MTFTEFFKTINDTKIFDCTREWLVINIYQAAGCSGKISYDCAKQWLKRNKPGQPISYFPNYNIDKKGFVKYFQDNVANSWTILLDAFRALEDTGVVDCNPANASVFYLSLLKQFYEILGFPWTTPPKERMYEIFNVIPPKDDRPFEEIFNDAIFSYNVMNFLESDPTESLASYFFDDMKTFVIVIQRSNEDTNTLHKDEKAFCKMYEFSETLLKYVTYLEEQMNLVYTKTGNNKSDIYSRQTYLAKYEPPNDNKDFGNRTLNYRNSLKSLYDEIKSLYKEEQPPKKLYPVIF